MARLKTASRNKLKSNEFGLPTQRKYPIEDKSHAQNAKARASQMEAQGKISAKEKREIDTRADKVLGKSEETMAKKAAHKATGHKKTTHKKVEHTKGHHAKEAKRHAKLAAHHAKMAEGHMAKFDDSETKPSGAKMPVAKGSGNSKQDTKPPIIKRKTNDGMNNSGWGGPGDNAWGSTATKEGFFK